MAKKSKKAAPKKPAAQKAKSARGKATPRRAVTPKGRWTAPGAKARAAAAKDATKTPKNVPLIKGLRIRALDNVFGHISDTRAAIARLQGEEADLERHGHELMKKHDQTTWSHAGVTASRIPGEEKIRYTTARARGPAPAAEPEDNGPVQTPERADAVNDEDSGVAGAVSGDTGDLD